MSDLISKNQSLIEWKEDFKGFVECLDIPKDDYKGIMAYIDEVPSAEPRKTGKWIYYDPNGFKCSRCGSYLEIGCGDVKMNFCPNCGCQMNGGEQE